MKEGIKNLSGIELRIGPRGEYYLYITSTTLGKRAMLSLQSLDKHHTDRKVFDAWIGEQLAQSAAN